jgi:WD40 repeat protein
VTIEIGGYAVEREVGRGGMGVVLRARAPDGRTVAIKLLLHASKPEARARFGREQRLLASLGERDGFVPLTGAGDSPRGPFLVMPFLEGGTLRDRMSRGPLGVEEARALGVALATALGRAHERGIVHRDLKPENVLFTADGRPLVSDLGLAKHFSQDTPGSSVSVSLSKTGETKGSIGYMPPEQVGDSSRVGPQSDVFALAAILYECLAGLNPFEADNPHAMIGRASTGDFTPLRKARADVPRGLARTIERALSPIPGERFAGGTDFARALAHDDPEPVISRPLAIGLALAAVVAIGGGVLLAKRAAPAPSRGASPGPPAPTPSPTPERRVVDAGRFPACARSFLESRSRSARLEAVLGSYAGRVGERCEPLAWSPDGKLLLVGNQGAQVALVDASSGELVREPDALDAGVTSVAFSLDGRLDAAATVSGLVKVSEVPSGTTRLSWKHEGGWVRSVAFSPDGQTVASATDAGTIELHDLTTGDLVNKFGARGHGPDALGFLSDGRIVTGGQEKPVGKMCVFRLGTENQVQVFDGHKSIIRGLAVSKDTRVLTAGYDMAVILWDVSQPTPVRSFACPEKAIACAFSPDGTLGAGCGFGGFVTIWDLASGQVVRSFEPHGDQVLGVVFSPDGTRIATSSLDGCVRIREVATGRDVWPQVGHRSPIHSVAVAGKELVLSAGEDGTCRVWDAKSGRELRSLLGHEGSVNAVSVTPDGRRAFSAGADGMPRFWDLPGGSVVRAFHPMFPPNIAAAAVSPDGRHAFTGEDKYGVRYWDLESLTEDNVPLEAERRFKVLSVALSPDGKLGLSGGDDKFGILWSLDTRKRAMEFPHDAPVTAVAFAPDSKNALTGSADGTLRSWDLTGGVRLRPAVSAHEEKPVTAVVVFPDGKRAASAGRDRTVRIWRYPDLIELDRIDLRSSLDHATSLDVSKDGRVLYAGTRRGPLLVFALVEGAAPR